MVLEIPEETGVTAKLRKIKFLRDSSLRNMLNSGSEDCSRSYFQEQNKALCQRCLQLGAYSELP